MHILTRALTFECTRALALLLLSLLLLRVLRVSVSLLGPCRVDRDATGVVQNRRLVAGSGDYKTFFVFVVKVDGIRSDVLSGSGRSGFVADCF
jgi:hypothetical protein